MIMKFEVQYIKPKKKGYSKQVATLYNIEDAEYWKSVIEKQGCKDIQIIPIPIL